MFKISCLVEDKKLHMALHALDGLVVEMEPPLPVKGHPQAAEMLDAITPVPSVAERTFVPGVKPKQARSRGGRKRIGELRGLVPKGHVLQVEDIKNLIEKLGWKRTSYTFATQALADERALAVCPNDPGLGELAFREPEALPDCGR